MKKILRVLLISVLLLNCFVFKASADVGPKPSITIYFENNSNGEYYVTLLSSSDHFGPWAIVEQDDFSGYTGNEYDAYKAFYDYCENDDFYLLKYVYECSKNNEFSWSYYPPNEFKIAVYDCVSKTLKVSDVIKREAFDSYYNVVIDNELIVKEEVHIKEKLISFAIRVILTILVELVLGLLFRYRSKKEIKTIIIVNIITQIILNIIMLILDYTSGALVWIIVFPILEVFVIIIETIIYCIAFKGHKKIKTVFYTILANLITLCIGAISGMMV